MDGRERTQQACCFKSFFIASCPMVMVKISVFVLQVVAYDGRLCNLQIEWQRLLQHNRQRCESLQKTCQAQAEANAQMQGRVGCVSW